MNIRRLEVLAISALYLLVLAWSPLWQLIGHTITNTGCRLTKVPGVVAIDHNLAFHVGNLPMLIFGVLLVAIGLSLLFDCCKRKGSPKEMYSCASCSTPYEPGNKFCHSCGSEL